MYYYKYFVVDVVVFLLRIYQYLKKLTENFMTCFKKERSKIVVIPLISFIVLNIWADVS